MYFKMLATNLTHNAARNDFRNKPVVSNAFISVNLAKIFTQQCTYVRVLKQKSFLSLHKRTGGSRSRRPSSRSSLVQCACREKNDTVTGCTNMSMKCSCAHAVSNMHVQKERGFFYLQEMQTRLRPLLRCLQGQQNNNKRMKLRRRNH